VRVLLVILCLLLVLFSGGCSLLLGVEGMGLAVAPIAVLVLNSFILAALFGWADPWRPAFYILAVVDFIIAGVIVLGAMMLAANMPGGDEASLIALAALLAGGFALKGFLTWRYVRGLPPP
jgi:peptidoglycan/LPS O-acetylase OafA/YrhL